jgi:hypothetical protein
LTGSGLKWVPAKVASKQFTRWFELSGLLLGEGQAGAADFSIEVLVEDKCIGHWIGVKGRGNQGMKLFYSKKIFISAKKCRQFLTFDINIAISFPD